MQVQHRRNGGILPKSIDVPPAIIFLDVPPRKNAINLLSKSLLRAIHRRAGARTRGRGHERVFLDEGRDGSALGYGVVGTPGCFAEVEEYCYRRFGLRVAVVEFV